MQRFSSTRTREVNRIYKDLSSKVLDLARLPCSQSQCCVVLGCRGLSTGLTSHTTQLPNLENVEVKAAGGLERVKARCKGSLWGLLDGQWKYYGDSILVISEYVYI